MKQNHMLNIRFDVVLGVNRHYMLRFFFPPWLVTARLPLHLEKVGLWAKLNVFFFFLARKFKLPRMETLKFNPCPFLPPPEEEKKL